MENYIDILIRSLEKKIAVLDQIVLENQQQKEILQQEEWDMDLFRKSMEKKAKFIDELNFLDEGFETMYERVKDLLETNREEHKEDIHKLQKLIMNITDKSVNIQKEEQQNRRLAEMQFGKEHKKVRQVKASSQTASQYYKNMSKLNYIEPQFMDKKK